jgi:mannan endo-1,4-beta-mannosidase
MLTRRNSLSGVAYKDDPTIMAWELMNEIRCPSDHSGNTVQVNLNIVQHTT